MFETNLSKRGATVRAADGAPHLLIGWPVDPGDQPLLAALGAEVRVTKLDVTGTGARGFSRRLLAPVDVALLRADRLGVEGSALLHDADLGFPEVIFVVDEAWSPERLALESRGFRYIVARNDLSSWLPGVLSQLCALTRARRGALAASANKPLPPSLPPSQRLAGRLTLHAAETRFRETYLRLLLAERGSRRRAADEAGVPYRSFCEMLRKLGI